VFIEKVVCCGFYFMCEYDVDFFEVFFVDEVVDDVFMIFDVGVWFEEVVDVFEFEFVVG